MAKSKLIQGKKIIVVLILPKLDPDQRTVEVGETGFVKKITEHEVYFQMDSDNYEFYLSNDDYECDSYFKTNGTVKYPPVNSKRWLEGE